MYEEFASNEQIRIEIDPGVGSPDREKIAAALSGFPCTTVLDADDGSVDLDYCPAVVSRTMIAEALTAAGFPENKAPTPGALEARLNRMAESSRKAFGSGSLDCCNLNSKKGTPLKE